MNILNVYGKNLKKFRTKKNISQEELALLCDLNWNFIGLIERGKRGILLKNIEIISKTLDIEIYKFFLDEEKNIWMEKTDQKVGNLQNYLDIKTKKLFLKN